MLWAGKMSTASSEVETGAAGPLVACSRRGHCSHGTRFPGMVLAPAEGAIRSALLLKLCVEGAPDVP